MKRAGKIQRKTRETDIQITMNLDGKGHFDINTGIGFFDHMLESLSHHSLIDMTVKADGDLNVDDHHTVEDVGICLGQVLNRAAANMKGIQRFGWALCPMDETLARAAVDLCGRPTFVVNWEDIPKSLRGMENETILEFFKALAAEGRICIHLDVLRGKNRHHILEALFKSLALALRQALTMDERRQAVPSTKGTLS
ncbi:imidazoleglycerol-phosphate dehydratase HisB [bacterium]